MSDLISRKAAKLKVARVIWEDGDSRYDFHDKCIDCLDDVPPEPSEIIHCRDCKHYYFADNRIPQEQRYVCDIGGEIWQPDDFCSYGERREEDEE